MGPLRAVCNAWAANFAKDFTSYSSQQDRALLEELLNTVPASAKCRSDCWDQRNVEISLQRLSTGKCSGPDGIMPELLKYAPLALATHLSLFFRACETHGFIPEELSNANIHPVPKAGKSPSEITSYRPITIGSVTAKVFEECIMRCYGHCMQSSELQFGFKAGTGTAQCSLAMKSIARHFVERGSVVYAALLDATKAFDRANYAKIFQQLLLRGVPASVVRLLYRWYAQTNVRVAWNGATSSEAFGIEHSVRQGGLLSPILFSLLYDSLLTRLRFSGIGCHINGQFVGTLAYADDVVLMAPSIQGLNKLLAICNKWSSENHIQFNPQKSIAICLHGNRRRMAVNASLPVFIGETRIPTATEVTHLGHVISADLTDSAEVFRIAKAYNRQFNAFFAKFHTLRDRGPLLPLYSTFCSSFYGIESVFPTLCSTAAKKFLYKSVNLSLMKLMSLPRESISPFLIAEGVQNAETTWRIRSLHFWKSIHRSSFEGRIIFPPHKQHIQAIAREVGLGTLSMPSVLSLPRTQIAAQCLYTWQAAKILM